MEELSSIMITLPPYIGRYNKNNLYSYLQNHSNPELKRKYNKMKKTLKKAIFAAETNYYKHRFEQCQNQSRKTWGLINEITCRKKGQKIQFVF